MSERKLFTSESVSEGHPDKIADQISDAILDAILAEDPDAHVAAETAVYTGSVHIFGEVSTTAYVDINRVVRDTIAEIGYNNAEYGFAAESVGVHPSLIEQSPDIAQGVNESLEVRGTGDQDSLDLMKQKWVKMKLMPSEQVTRVLCLVSLLMKLQNLCRFQLVFHIN